MFLFNAAVTRAVDFFPLGGGRCWTGGFLVGADVFVEGEENPTICQLMPDIFKDIVKYRKI